MTSRVHSVRTTLKIMARRAGRGPTVSIDKARESNPPKSITDQMTGAINLEDKSNEEIDQIAGILGISPAAAPVMNSWKPQQNVDGDTWSDNALRFPTQAEAAAHANDTFSKWFASKGHRAVESEDPPNYRYIDGQLKAYDPTEDTVSPPLETSPPEAAEIEPGIPGLINSIYAKLKAGESLGNVTELTKLAERHLGSGRTEGEWTPKTMFDAMEGGINKLLIERGGDLMRMDAIDGLKELRNLMSRITTQGVRTQEQIDNQQFSTPPTEAYIANKVANVQPDDVLLETSAGNGGLAVFGKGLGADVHVNEISPVRRGILSILGFDGITDHDGELINALLDRDVHPTVVVINPPFSASTLKSHKARNNNQYGFNHLESALQRLQPGGRLVAILGGGQANEPEGGASFTNKKSGAWFQKIGKRYNVRANVRINGKEYQKYGTNFATRIIVIDKNGPTVWANRVTGNVDTLEEAYGILKQVADTRPIAEKFAGDVRAGSQPSAGTNGTGGGVAGAQSQSGAGTRSGRGGAAGNRGRGVQGGPRRPGSTDVEVQPGGGDLAVRQGEPDVRPPDNPIGQPGAGGGESPERPADLGVTLSAKERILAAAAKKLDEKLASQKPSAPSAPAKAPTQGALITTVTTPAVKAALTAEAQRAIDAMRARRANRKLGESAIVGKLEPEAINEEDLTDLAAVAAEFMVTGSLKFDDWSARMMEALGDLVNGVAEDTGSTPGQVLRLAHEYGSILAEARGFKPEPTPADVQIEPNGIERLQLEKTLDDKSDEEDTDQYVKYKSSLQGKEHPGQIVETKTMATVPLPNLLSYKPALPPDVDISNVQMEGVAIAGIQNSIVLPGGYRAWALLGDGTGVGKGREGAAIAWDNWRQGRKRIVFVSVKPDLMQDFARDLHGIGAEGDLLKNTRRNDKGVYTFNKTSSFRPLSDWDAGQDINHEGIIFASYHILTGGDSKGNLRINQLERYLQGDDNAEGAYIIFDESHRLKNAVAAGRAKSSKVGAATKTMIEHLPNLRGVSLSATAATEVNNLGYLDRLGIWGPGTSFPGGFQQFQQEVGVGKMAAMEMIARELKALGKYVSRTLSFKGVTFSEVEHQINAEQKDLFRTATKAWRTVLDAANDTIDNTTNGGKESRSAFEVAVLRCATAFLRYPHHNTEDPDRDQAGRAGPCRR